MRITALFTLALLSLAACGNRDTADPSALATAFGQIQTMVKGRTAPPAAPPTLPTRAELTTGDTPVILVSVPSRNAQATLGVIQESATTRSYLSADGIALMTQGDIVSGTRGFGDDLMSSDHADVLANLRRGTGRHTRTLRHLNALDQLHPTILNCDVTSQGRETITILGKTHRTQAVTEVCTGEGGTITNSFFLERGRIVKSNQWVSPSVGMLLIEQVQ